MTNRRTHLLGFLLLFGFAGSLLLDNFVSGFVIGGDHHRQQPTRSSLPHDDCNPVRIVKSRSKHNRFPSQETTTTTTPTSLNLSPNDIMNRSEALLQPLLFPAVFIIAFRIGAALSVIGQPRLPSDTNFNYPVGSKILRLPKLGSRIRLFYPCTVPTTTTGDNNSNNTRYCTDGRATSDGMAGLVGFKQLGLSFLLAHLANASSGCYENAEPYDNNNNKKKFPLLVYSHGYGGNMDMATYFLREIAGQGMIVAALEHTDGTASSTVLKDGNRLDFSPNLYSARDGVTLRSNEMLEAVDYLSQLLPNVDKVLLGGHSYGAPTAILASQNASIRRQQISGLILHDPALGMGYNLLDLPPKMPTISYTSDEYNRGGVRCGDVTFHVKGAYHGNFVDAPLWAPLWVMRTLSLIIPACGPDDPNQIHHELAESAMAFANDPIGRNGIEQSLFERTQ